MAEGALVALGGGDVRLVDDDEVDVVRLQLGEQVVEVLAGAERVEVGHQDVGVEQLIAGDVADRAVVPVQHPHRRGWTAGNQRSAWQAVEDVQRVAVVQRPVEGAADHRAGRDDHHPSPREPETGEHAERGLAGAHRHDRSVVATLGVVVGESAEGLGLAVTQGLAVDLLASEVEVVGCHGRVGGLGDSEQRVGVHVVRRGDLRVVDDEAAEQRIVEQQLLELLDASRRLEADRVIREPDDRAPGGVEVVLAEAVVGELQPVGVEGEASSSTASSRRSPATS